MRGSSSRSGAIRWDIARQIRTLRKKQHFSQSDLAKASGLSRNTLSMLERGRTSPTLATIRKIAVALEVDVGYLFQPNLWVDTTESKRVNNPQVPMQRKVKSDEEVCSFQQLVSAHILRLEPGAMSEFPLTHCAKAIIYCLRGMCQFSTEGNSYILESGEILTIDGNRSQRYQNPDRNSAEILVILLETAQ